MLASLKDRWNAARGTYYLLDQHPLRIRIISALRALLGSKKGG